MTTFTVVLPDGNTDKRKSKHNYKYACGARWDGKGKWWAYSFSATKEGAEKKAKYLETCPAVRSGNHTVEVAVIEVQGDVI